MESLQDRVAVVTGASRGIGRAIAIELARQGTHVALVARSESQLREVAREVEAHNRRALVLPTDVGDEFQVKRMADSVLGEFGRADILVNNAGKGLWSTVDKMTLQQWNDLIALNLTGVFLCCRAFYDTMKQQGSGHIITISSGAGKQGYPRLSAYCTTKFGVIGFSEALAAELMPFGVKVTTILPGSVDTSFADPILPERKPGQVVKVLEPQDVAEAIVYLVSQPRSAWTQEMNLWPNREKRY